MPSRKPQLAKAPRTVIGYHGCSRDAAERILEEQRFLSSTNAYDWLGEGIYFWEYAPYRAMDWAEVKCAPSGEEPAVIGAHIRLGRCLNLLDTARSRELVRTYEQIRIGLGSRRIPRNTDSGAHYLDCDVINAYCLLVQAENEYTFQNVRGCYPEGDPVYPGSKILALTHVQIAVRDITCISGVHLVEFP